jgi:ribose transport system substrate-binding protein
MKIAQFVVGALMACLLAACGDASQKAPPITTGDILSKGPAVTAPQVRVALIMKTITNPFFMAMEMGARKAQEETGIDLQVKTATQETSIEQQIQLVEQEIQAKAQAIVIAPGDSLRLVPVLKKAQDAGIQVVNIDNRLSAEAMAASGMKPVPFISVDNAQAAYQVTQTIAQKVSTPTEAVVIEGIRTADNAEQRKRGALRAFAENAHIRVVASESANWKIDEAYQLAKTLFKAHPNIGLVFCANDMMAIGVIKYVQDVGLHQVQIVGFDALEEAKTAIKAGQLVATIDQQADRQGYQGVITALQLLKGEKPPMEIMVPAQVVTATSLR